MANIVPFLVLPRQDSAKHPPKSCLIPIPSPHPEPMIIFPPQSKVPHTTLPITNDRDRPKSAKTQGNNKKTHVQACP